jgi:hypothetical protein
VTTDVPTPVQVVQQVPTTQQVRYGLINVRVALQLPLALALRLP